MSDFPGQHTNFPHPTDEDEVTIEVVDRHGRRLKHITDFALQDITFKWSSPESAAFTVNPLNPTVAYLPLKTNDVEIRITFPGEETPFWGEPVSKAGVDTLTYQCEGLLSKFGQRFIDRASLILTSVPQREIVQALVEYAQSEADQDFRDLNIEPRWSDLGGSILNKLRSRQYFREEHTSILDAMDEFASLDYAITLKMAYEKPGFGFTGLAGKWKRFLDIIPVYDIVHPLSVPLVYGLKDEPSNITLTSFAEDAGGLANDIYCGGGSAGAIKFEGHYTDQESASIHGIRQAIINHGDMTDPAWLEDRAKKETEERKSPKQTITVRVANQANAIGRYAWVGTIWPVRIDYGAIQVDGNFRIVSRKILPNYTFLLTLEQIMKPIQRPDQALLEWPKQV